MSDNIKKSRHPDWLRTALREAPIRARMVLYGNVRDCFFDPEQRQYVRLGELLSRLFQRDRSLDHPRRSVGPR